MTGHGLVEVAYLDREFAAGAGHRPEVADMTIATNTDRRALGQRVRSILVAA
jgi:hypothetical protein